MTTLLVLVNPLLLFATGTGGRYVFFHYRNMYFHDPSIKIFFYCFFMIYLKICKVIKIISLQLVELEVTSDMIKVLKCYLSHGLEKTHFFEINMCILNRNSIEWYFIPFTAAVTGTVHHYTPQWH